MNALDLRIVFAMLLGLCFTGRAQVTFTTMASADAFVCTGSPSNPAGADQRGTNFGAAGMVAVAPGSSVKGEFQGLIRFPLTNALALFNGSFGAGRWVVTNITLDFASNYGVGGVQPNNALFNVISGGDFVIEWLATDQWAEGTGSPSSPTSDGVTYNSLPAVLAGGHEPLCTNTYAPPGNNVRARWALPLATNLLADIGTGGEVTFRLYAADDRVNYLFNSYSYGRGNEPMLHVTVTALPPRLAIVAGQEGSFVVHLAGLGAANQAYKVQANGDLTTNWRTLDTVTADTNGLVHYDDLTATNQAQRFYRLLQ